MIFPLPRADKFWSSVNKDLCNWYLLFHLVVKYVVVVVVKVGKSRKKYGVLDSSKKRSKLSILSTEGAQDSEFCCSFFWKNPGRKILLSRFTDL